MGTRSHFNHLKNDWIKLEANTQDTKVRVCSPKDKLLFRFKLIFTEIEKVCK